jgi:hypothetical protein
MALTVRRQPELWNGGTGQADEVTRERSSREGAGLRRAGRQE